MPTQGVGLLVQGGEQAFDRGDYDEAIAAYAEALDRMPWNDRLVANLAAAYAERARRAREHPGVKPLERAEADLRSAVRLRPDDPVLQANLAVVLVERANRVMDPTLAGELRAEARRLNSGVEAGVGLVQPLLERRIDLAFELLERGQLEAGILRLQALRRDYPESREVAMLLGQALARQATKLDARGEYAPAAEAFGRAVAVFAELGACEPAPCEPAPCDEREIRLAHHNRIVAWLNADRPADARAALLEAEAAGLEFPRLRRALAPR